MENDHSVYVWGGSTDPLCPPKGFRTIKDVYENYGTSVKFEENPDYGHLFPEGTITIGIKEIYTNLGFIDEWNDPAPANELYKYGRMRAFD